MKNKNSRRPPHCRSFAGNLFKREYKNYWIVVFGLLIILFLFLFKFYFGVETIKTSPPSELPTISVTSECPSPSRPEIFNEIGRACALVVEALANAPPVAGQIPTTGQMGQASAPPVVQGGTAAVSSGSVIQGSVSKSPFGSMVPNTAGVLAQANRDRMSRSFLEMCNYLGEP